MSNEDLLMPRYKLIGNYPGCPNSMPIGHILTLNLVFFDLRFHGYTELEPVHLEEPGFDNYPAVFKRLEWWEDREVKDMPLFIRNKTARPISYTKIDEWRISIIVGEMQSLTMVVNGKERNVNLWAIEPADEPA